MTLKADVAPPADVARDHVAPVIEIELDGLPCGADVLEKAARDYYSANFEIFARNGGRAPLRRRVPRHVAGRQRPCGTSGGVPHEVRALHAAQRRRRAAVL